MDPDMVLLERWRSGDKRAGEDLFARHFADIYRFFEHKAGADTDELTQKTFLACVKARDQFRGQSSFRTYLFTLARHELYAYLRARPRHRQVDFEVTSIAEIVTPPSGRFDRARQVELLRAALRELPAEQQLLLELHYWHDFDAAQLAEVFNTNAGAVRVRLLRGRRALREKMARLGPGALGPPEAGDRLAASLSEIEPAEGGGSL
jgi:RNA polymerase sigma factor (sigma-70 family)